MKKLTRLQLRKILINEVRNTINEATIDDLESFYRELQQSLTQFGLTISPVGFAATYFNHKDAIDAAYAEGGTEAAAEKFRVLYGQLVKDVGAPLIDKANKLVD